MTSHEEATESAQVEGAEAASAETLREQTLLVALERAEAGLPLEPEPVDGEEFLLFWLGESPYLVRLVDLREALPSTPPHVALPFSPQWLWGIFPLHSDLVALVDPTPVLAHGPVVARSMTHVGGPEATTTFGRADSPRALVVGEGDRVLALVTDRVGDICVLRPEHALPPEHASDATANARAEYVEAVYSTPCVDRPVAVLRMARLCDDIFAAIEEQPAHE